MPVLGKVKCGQIRSPANSGRKAKCVPAVDAAKPRKNIVFPGLSADLRCQRVYRRPKLRAIPAEKAGEKQPALAIMT